MTIADFTIQLDGYYDNDRGHYDTELVDAWPTYRSIAELLKAAKPDYDALIADCIRNGTAVEV